MGNVPEKYKLETLNSNKYECTNYHQQNKRKWKKEESIKEGKRERKNIVKSSLAQTGSFIGEFLRKNFL